MRRWLPVAAALTLASAGVACGWLVLPLHEGETASETDGGVDDERNDGADGATIGDDTGPPDGARDGDVGSCKKVGDLCDADTQCCDSGTRCSNSFCQPCVTGENTDCAGTICCSPFFCAETKLCVHCFPAGNACSAGDRCCSGNCLGNKCQ